MQGAGSRIQRDAVPGFAKLRKFLFERGDFRAEAEGRVAADAVERVKNFLAQSGVLRLQVEIRNFHQRFHGSTLLYPRIGARFFCAVSLRFVPHKFPRESKRRGTWPPALTRKAESEIMLSPRGRNSK